MKKAWQMATVSILTGIVFAIGLFKVPPTMMVLMDVFHVDMTVVGLTMSVGAIASAISALPGGVIMQKLGPKKLGLIAITEGAVGCLIGLFTTNYTLFLVGRALEGAAFGIIAIVVSGIIAIWFPPEKRGLPMSIFTLWVSLGMLTILNVTNLLVPRFGWKGVWWFHLILLGICFVLFAVVIGYPKKTEAEEKAEMAQPTVSILEGFRSKGAWLLGMVFFTYSITNAAFTTFYPTYLQQNLGMDMAASNLYTSISTLGMLACGIFIGFLLNRMKNRNHPNLLIIAAALTSIFTYVQFQIEAVSILPVFLFLIGVIYQSSPPIIFTIAPDVATSPRTIGATLSVVTLCSAMGGIVGPSILGPIVAASSGNWSAVSIPLLVITLIGLVASILLNGYVKSKTLNQNLAVGGSEN